MCPFFSEEASLVTSLQDELKNLKEEMVQLHNTTVSEPLDVLPDSASKAALQEQKKNISVIDLHVHSVSAVR